MRFLKSSFFVAVKSFFKGFLISFFVLFFASFSISSETEKDYLAPPSTAVDMDEPKARNVIPIGVILPLTGKYADFGEAVLKGILLGAEIFGKVGEGFLPVEIVLRDSQGDPQKAADAVEELARNEDVIAILGPLLSRTSFSAAKRAQEFKMPLITFSQADDIAGVGDYIFRNSLTPSMQAREVVKYAVEDMGIKRFGILYPDTSYGKSLTEHFRAEVKRLGGEIVREEEYKVNQTDFGENLRRLFRIKNVEVKRDKDKDVKKFTPPPLDFEALYIPDYFDRIVLIAPQLVFYDIRGLQLLGSNGWNSSMLMEMGDRYVENAVFVDSFFLHSEEIKVKDFVKAFKANFGLEPGILEAQGYDTVKLLLALMRMKDVRDREKLKDEIGEVKYFPGVAGETSFNEKGEAVKELYILKVEGKRIISLKTKDSTSERRGNK